MEASHGSATLNDCDRSAVGPCRLYQCIDVSATGANDRENQAYMAAMERMQEQMKKGMDSDPTKAWAKMMIPHHGGVLRLLRRHRGATRHVCRFRRGPGHVTVK